ncbi:MAG: DUF4212 domain-containing protein [Sumerlaeia bacterium]
MSETQQTPEAPRPETVESPLTRRDQEYWRANLKLILALLAVWAFVSFVCSILLIEVLNKISLGGVPFGFWMAQQGSIYVFVVLIGVYVLGMRRLERKYGVPSAPQGGQG